MQSRSRAVAISASLSQSRRRILQVFIMAIATIIAMSVWMVAKADPPRAEFYSGTFQPVPNVPYNYGYNDPYNYNPRGHYYVPPQPATSYPMGPVNPPIGPVIPPFMTTLPSAGYYAPYDPYYGYAPPRAPRYPYPTWYPQNQTYFSGPVGSGGSIQSNSTVTNRGGGITYDRGKWGINLGNGTTHSSSNTTVTTHR